MLAHNPHYNYWEFRRLGLLSHLEERLSGFSQCSISRQGTIAVSGCHALVQPGCVKKKGKEMLIEEMEDRNIPLGSLGACESFCWCTSNSGQGRGREVGWWENGKHILSQGELWNLIMLSNCRRLRNPWTAWEIWHQMKTEWCDHACVEVGEPQGATAPDFFIACPWNCPSNAMQREGVSMLALEAPRCLGQGGLHSETGGTGRCPADLQEAAPKNRENYSYLLWSPLKNPEGSEFFSFVLRYKSK